MIKALVFDLDDTLYKEKDFLESGYRAVARHLSARFGYDFERLYSTMLDTLNSMGRQMVFPAVKDNLSEKSIAIDDLVAIYRNHAPAIQLFPGYFDFLRKLSRSYRLGIITDGMPEVQERKVRALGLENLIDHIIYTWKYGREKQKPHTHSFRLMLDSLQTEASYALYVGDNPSKDCTGAHRAGMKYAQVRSWAPSEYACESHLEEMPDFIIDTLFQLTPILQELN